MRNIIFVALVLFGFQMNAQDSELEAFKDLFNSEKKIALGEFMGLDATETARFWEIYDEYSLEREDLVDRRITLLKKYVYQYGSLSNEEANDIVKETFSIRDKSDKIQWKYYKKFEKEFGAKKASQFVQFERYVQTSIDNELQTALPMIAKI